MCRRVFGELVGQKAFNVLNLVFGEIFSGIFNFKSFIDKMVNQLIQRAICRLCKQSLVEALVQVR